MSWFQKRIVLQPKARGLHLITAEILAKLPELQRFQVGLAHLFLCHTSASLTINENADPDVRRDLETQLRRLAPDGAPHYTHTLEGGDDMPAHIKCSLLGTGLLIPVGQGRLLLGTWQGIYLGEHREHGGARTLIATVTGSTTPVLE